MPKGRQLSAMGREGLYAEDRTDIYTGGTGSSTQSTGSGRSGFGTLSPSFFPIKPPDKLVQQFRSTGEKVRSILGELRKARWV